MSRAWIGVLVGVVVAGAVACPTAPERDRGAYDPSHLPPDVASDYQVFAARCSKCHGLDRAIDRGAHDDEYWKNYVARMRRQPASGITVEDTVPILRFLHYFSDERRAAAASASTQGSP
ncbi:MAG: hypothetical protein NVS3B10_29380 [Polyangiales bacterium]